jgi:hypothetical protein
MDTRLYFLKDPIVIVAFIFIGVLGVTLKQHKKHKQQGTVTQYKIESNTETDITKTQQKTDTTEWRKSYYEHLYSNSK